MTWIKGLSPEKKNEPKEYPWGKLYPYSHTRRMNWAKAFITEGDVDLIILPGQTGRDPVHDRPAKDFQDERGEGGAVVGPGIKEQTIQAMNVIKQTLEEFGATLENIVVLHFYLVNPNDVWDFRQTYHDWCMENCPDLIENPRCSTLLRGVGLDLPGKMVIEIEAWAIRPRKKVESQSK